jgi:hypothetical protein
MNMSILTRGSTVPAVYESRMLRNQFEEKRQCSTKMGWSVGGFVLDLSDLLFNERLLVESIWRPATMGSYGSRRDEFTD